MKHILKLTLIAFSFIIYSCSSDDSSTKQSIIPVTDLSQIQGNWKLVEVKMKSGEVFMSECSIEGSKLYISMDDLKEYRRISNVSSNDVCYNNIQTYSYNNLNLISTSNLMCSRNNSSTKYKFGVELKGNNLIFYLYQIVTDQGNTTIGNEEQVVFYYMKE